MSRVKKVQSAIGNATDSVLVWGSPRLTRRIAEHWGSRLGFVYVSEFPKSGGNWVCRMLADYSLLPFPQHSRLPIAMKAVLHNHWDYSESRVPSLYVYRDGRDVMVSLYFHMLTYLRTGRYLHDRIARRRYFQLFGSNLDPAEISSRLPQFIEFQMTSPFGIGTKLSWPDHVRAWNSHDRVHSVAYESLLVNPLGEMEKILKFIGFDVDYDRLTASVAREAFTKRTGRQPGQHDPDAFLRKGISGDWKNYFTYDAAKTFEAFGGEALRLLGYEQDSSWVTGSGDPSISTPKET